MHVPETVSGQIGPSILHTENSAVILLTVVKIFFSSSWLKVAARKIADRGAAKGHGSHGGALQQCQRDDCLGQMSLSSCISSEVFGLYTYVYNCNWKNFFSRFFQLRL